MPLFPAQSYRQPVCADCLKFFRLAFALNGLSLGCEHLAEFLSAESAYYVSPFNYISVAHRPSVQLHLHVGFPLSVPALRGCRR